MCGGVPCPMSGWRSTPARSRWWGVPQPGLDGGGVPHPRYGVGGNSIPGLDGGGTPFLGMEYPGQVWMVGGTPARSGWWEGTPSEVWGRGNSIPGLDGVGYPIPGVGGTQPGLDGGRVPSGQVWMVGGTPPQLDRAA